MSRWSFPTARSLSLNIAARVLPLEPPFPPGFCLPYLLMKQRLALVRRVAPADVLLFANALACCVAIRVALWTLPSAKILRYVHRRVAQVRLEHQRDVPIARVAWAIRAAGRRTPRSTCLVEALAAQLLLAQRGQQSDLRVGVARNASNEFAAHAWLEVGGKVVVGGATDMKYSPLPDFCQLLG